MDGDEGLKGISVALVAPATHALSEAQATLSNWPPAISRTIDRRFPGAAGSKLIASPFQTVVLHRCADGQAIAVRMFLAPV